MEEKKKKRINILNVVLGLLLLLFIVAIILPAIPFHPSKRGLLKIHCRSNLQQLINRSNAFKSENPQKQILNQWCDSIKVYFSEEDYGKFVCPTDEVGPCSYAMNENISADVNELPGDLVMLFESSSGWNLVGGVDDVVTDRHGRPGADIAFADGHVEFVEAEDIPNLRWTMDKSVERQ